MISVYDLHEALFSALRNDGALSGVITGIFDYRPANKNDGPYLVFEDTNATDGRVMDRSEQKVYLHVDIWSAYQGRKEVLMVADLIKQALPEAFFFDDLDVIRDDESGWRHGMMTLHAYTAE